MTDGSFACEGCRTMKQIAHGIYEALVDEYLRDWLARHPELRTVYSKMNAV